jgi:precorrin-2 dehydrogenase/sirohydrochlorin ferrochelatase
MQDKTSRHKVGYITVHNNTSPKMPPPTPPPPHLEHYPPIVPGGSLLLAWQLRDKRVLIIGGGEVASGRLRSVLEADAYVTLIAPSTNLHPEVRYRIFDDPYVSGRITYHDRTFHLPSTSLEDSVASTDASVSEFHDTDDLEGVDMVLTAIDDVTISKFIYELAHARHIPTNVADIPPSCDFYFGSQIRQGPLQIMVSTNGKGPKLASIVRQRVERYIEGMAPVEGGIGTVIDKVGALRERLRARAPGVGGAVGKKRMKWMIDVCERWSLEELALMDDGIMERLLDQGWDKGGKVPSFIAVGGTRAVTANLWSQIKAWPSLENTAHVLLGVSLGAVCAYGIIQWFRRR